MNQFELEERTFSFGRDIRLLVKKLGPGVTRSDVDQITRSSGSVGANYIEANEALGRKDFIMRLRICLKEAKETSFWLRIIESEIPMALMPEFMRLRNESEELRRIFSASVRTSERKFLPNQKIFKSMDNG